LKPYQAAEMRARVRALLRRGQVGESATITCGNLCLHRLERYATVDDKR
jgi:DNA-binding response OmpR family regulator